MPTPQDINNQIQQCATVADFVAVLANNFDQAAEIEPGTLYALKHEFIHVIAGMPLKVTDPESGIDTYSRKKR